MCNLDQYTLTDLQAMTKNAIITAWAQGRTYDEIVNREFDAAGQLIVLKWKTHTVLPNDVISQTKIKWLFHENGTIHKITHFDYSADGTLINRYTIFHDAEGHTPPYRVNEGTMPENGNGGAAMETKSVVSTILDLFKQPEPEVEPEPVKEIEAVDEPVIEPEPAVEVMPIIENETMTITGEPMVFTVEHPAAQVVEMEQPAVIEVPKLFGVPVMSKTLWRWIKRQ